MNGYIFPSDAIGLFARLRGRRITCVRRQVLRSDYDVLPADRRDEESDGPTELSFDDGTVIHFVPDTEQMSVRVRHGRMPRWGEHFKAIDTSVNRFCSRLLKSPLTAIRTFVSDFASTENRSEFAVALEFEDGNLFVVEYVSDSEHTDVLRVSGVEPVGAHRRIHLVD